MIKEILKVITIDGPAGSGKSTVAKMIANELGWKYVTTGAIYRTLALLLHEAGVYFAQSQFERGVRSDVYKKRSEAELVHERTSNKAQTVTARSRIEAKTENSHNIERFVSFINERYRQESGTGKVFIGEREVTHDIQNPLISKLSSVFAQDEFIRDKLLPIQRKIVCENNGAVVDGRDMGTVVFPDAPLKIYLTASPEERAKRRHKEFLADGEKIEFEKLLKEICERDNRDTNRHTAPLKPASDAIILDSTNMTQEDIASQILHFAVVKKLILS